MNVQILKQEESLLLGRQRVSALITFEGGSTPSILDFKKALAVTLKQKEEHVAVRHIYQRFGRAEAKVIAHVYASRSDLEHLEKLKKAERKLLEQQKKDNGKTENQEQSLK